MRISTFLSITVGSQWLIPAIAVAAVILATEIICISALVKKLIHANRKKKEEDRREYAAVLFTLGTLAAPLELLLGILAGLCALGAVAFAILLIVLRAKGYEILAKGTEAKDKPVSSAQPATVSPEPEILELVQGEPAEMEPAPLQELTEEPFTEATEELSEETIEKLTEEATEEPEAETPAELSSEAAEILPAESETSEANGETKPYRIVEKVVTETVREVVRDLPAESSSEEKSSQAALYDKLSDFLDFEMKRRMEEDGKKEDAEEKKMTFPQEEASDVAAFAISDDEDDEDEKEDAEDSSEEGENDSDDEGDEDSEHFTGNERIIGFDEKTGCYIVAHYRKSFEAKLIQSRPNIKNYYSELKNLLLSYKGTKARTSWTNDSFHNGRSPLAKINVKTRVLELYLALDPASLDGTVYRGRDVGKLKKYEDTPFQYKIRTPRKFKWAMELVTRVCEEHGLVPTDAEKVDYEAMYPFEDTDALVAKKLIKEYIREEKPASTFELDENHVPNTPDVDESVIPANANFIFEYDDENPAPQPEESAEEPIAEPIEEPIAEPIEEPIEKQIEEQPEPRTVRETVKVTQMRYTERYYDNGEPVVEESFAESEPMETETVTETEIEPETETETETETEAEIEEVTEPVAEETPAEKPLFTFPEDTEEEPEQIEDEAYIEEPAEDEAIETVDENGYEILADEPDEENPEAISDDLPDDDGEEAEPLEDEPLAENPDGITQIYDAEYSEDTNTEESPYCQIHYGEETYEETMQKDEAVESEEQTYLEESDEEQAEEQVEEQAEEQVEEPVEEPVSRRNVNPNIALVDVVTLEMNFPYGATVNIETLKQKGLVFPSATTLKIFATGTLSKALTVEANQFTLDAIRAIDEAGGESVMLY